VTTDIQLEHVPCALCGAQNDEALYHKFNLTIVRCRRCSFVYTNPRLPQKDLWTRYSEDYFWDEYLPTQGIGRDGSVDLDAFARHHAPLVHLVSMYAPPPGRLLEVGAAAGLFLKSAERAGWRVTGIEPMAAAAAFARDRLQLDVRDALIEEAAFDAGAFDAIVMFETIEHLLDPMAAMRAACRALGRGGTLVLTTPNFDALSRRVLGRQWAVLSPAEHLHYFTESTMNTLLRRAGFASVRFHRDFAPGPIETMNANYTNAPGSIRHRLYRTFVRRFGDRIFRNVQQRGMADTIVCVGHV
jgi:2-polyprenyl-3-methyl-5-hydroxy-6-metoxy-1,4-benzoquinol methylase